MADCFLAVGTHGPVAREPGKAHEIFVEFCPVGRVVHLGVELNRIEMAVGVCGDGKGRVRRSAVNIKSRCDSRDMIAVAHPHLFAPVRCCKPAVEQGEIVCRVRYKGTAELGSSMTALDLSAQHLHHHLLTVANAKDGHAEVKDRFRWAGGVCVDHRGRSAGQNDGTWGKVGDKSVRDALKRMDFAVHILLAQTARDELCHLASEVDDEKAVMRLAGHICAIGAQRDSGKHEAVRRGPAPPI